VTSEGLAEVTIRNSPVQDSRAQISELTEKIKLFLPKGWSASTADSKITLQRDQKVLWVPLLGRPAGNASETKIEYLQRIGTLVTFDLYLRFIPQLTTAEHQELSSKHAEVLQRAKNGFNNKTEISEYYRQEEKHKLPVYFISNYSVFVDGVPPAYTMHDDTAHQEMKAIFVKMKDLLQLYPGADPLPY